MLKVITLVCALLGLLIGVCLEAWVRKKITASDASNEAALRIRDRSRKFWATQYLPVIIADAVITVAVGMGIRWICAAVYLIGAGVSFISVVFGSASFRSGNTAAVSQAEIKDLKSALKAGYRSAAVMGLTTSCLGLLALGSVYLLLEPETLPKVVGCIALGASVTAVFLRISGMVYSGASNLAAKGGEFADYSGAFAGNGADHIETYLLSAAAAAVLAEVGVNTSGVTSTFTLSSASKFPLIIYAVGIIASVIGTMFYRANIKKNPGRGTTWGNFVSALIIGGATAYLSKEMLQSYVYAWCVGSGLLAGFITGEFDKLYSSDSLVFRRISASERNIRNGQSVIASLAAGMISALIPVVLMFAAVVASYNFASYYGIALSAVGMGAASCINSTVKGFAINSRSISEVIDVSVEDDMSTFSDIMYTTAVRADAAGKTYSAVSAMLASVAMLTAYIYSAGMQAVNLLNMAVLAGSALGVVMVFTFTGLIISSTAVTTRVIRERSDYSEEDGASNSLRGAIIPSVAAILVPAFIGCVGGINALAGFLTSFSITGTILVFVINNSGKYYESNAAETLTTVIKLALAISIAFMPVFTQLNGFLF